MGLPRSERDARARARRKINALQKRVWKDLHDIAGFFEEGPVAADIDRLIDDFKRGIEALQGSMDDEVERAQEREDCW